MIENPQEVTKSPTRGNRAPWWKGARGEWYLATQLVLIALVFLGPRTLTGLPDWPPTLAGILRFVGVILMVGGGLLLAETGQAGGAND